MIIFLVYDIFSIKIENILFKIFKSEQEDKLSPERPKREQLAGSTLAPNFPKVIIKKPKKLVGPFYVDDIKAIR